MCDLRGLGFGIFRVERAGFAGSRVQDLVPRICVNRVERLRFRVWDSGLCSRVFRRELPESLD